MAGVARAVKRPSGAVAQIVDVREEPVEVESLALAVSEAYGHISRRRFSGKATGRTAPLPYATAVRLFGKLFFILASAIERGYAPFVLRFTDEEIIALAAEFGLRPTYTKKNLQDWLSLLNRALKGKTSFEGKSGQIKVRFHLRTSDGVRFLWLDVAGERSFKTNELGEERSLTDVLGELRAERSGRLGWLATDLPELSDDEIAHVLSQIERSRLRRIVDGMGRTVKILIAILLSGGKKTAVIAAVAVLAAVRTLVLELTPGTPATFHYSGSGFQQGTKSASQLVLDSPRLGVHQELVALGGNVVNSKVDVAGVRDSYQNEATWKLHGGEFISIGYGASRKWVRMSVWLPHGALDGSYYFRMCGTRFDLTETVRLDDSPGDFGWVFHFVELPSTFTCLQGVPLAGEFHVIRDGVDTKLADVTNFSAHASVSTPH